jgi:hypothetical protein
MQAIQDSRLDYRLHRAPKSMVRDAHGAGSAFTGHRSIARALSVENRDARKEGKCA